MLKYLFLFTSIFLLSTTIHAQHKAENIIIITTDGLRWQELFKGLDTAIANNKRFNEGDSSLIYRNYASDTAEESRKKIFPFLWSRFVTEGQLYGNREYDTKVNLANPYGISYPGYSELLTGYADPKVNSNSYPNNPNTNFLGFLHRQQGFKNMVGAFGAWETFNRILNEPALGFPVIAAFDKTGGEKPTANETLINSMVADSYKPFGYGECLDVFSHYAAMEHLKTRQPRILYIAYGETDEWAHDGKYKSYLNAARQVDQWIEEVWNYVQSQPNYRNKTVLLVTTDHGRGSNRLWTEHGSSIQGSANTWFGIMGPGIKPKGEVKASLQFYQQQLAQTVVSLLGLTFTAEHPVTGGIEEVLK